MNSLNGVLIGAGYFAGFQAEAWLRIKNSKITAVADVQPQRAQKFAARWKIPRSYTDASEMLAKERPDFVDIATRPDSHFALTKLAAEAGAHVICQKPMGPTFQECIAMEAICRTNKVRLIMHENWRWQPWYREIKCLLESGVFGTPFHVGFQMRTGDGRGSEPYPVQPYFRDLPRFVMYEVAVHFIDTFRYLVGEVESVFCQIHRINPLIRGEDYAVAQLTFQSGARGLIDSNRISGPFPPETALGTFRLEGDRAMIRLSPDGQLWLTEYGQAEKAHPYSCPATGYKSDSVRAFQENAIASLITGQRNETEASDYLRSVAVVFASYDSVQTGRLIGMREWSASFLPENSHQQIVDNVTAPARNYTFSI